MKTVSCQHIIPFLCAGLATYSSLRPLVYRESSVVLLCFQDQGRPGLPAWVKEVRDSNVLRNLLLPISYMFIVHLTHNAFTVPKIRIKSI